MMHALVDTFTRHASLETIAWLYDHAPQWLIRQSAQSHFRQTMRWVATHSPFYRREFAKHGIDPSKVSTPEDLGDFYTTPEDLVEHATEFICRSPSMVFESSGTTGRNKRIYYGHDELQDIGRMMAAGFRMMGITAEDRVANAYDFSIWIPGLLCHYGLMAGGTFCLAFGKVDPDEVYRRMGEYNFTVIMGEPTWLIRLTELAEQHGAFPIKLMVGAAEEMPEKAIPWIEDVWRGAKVKMCYGSVEQGASIGFQPCRFTDGYHIDDVDFISEVVDRDADGYGEFVFTTLRRTVMPLIRYRTQDVARFLSEPCPCGRRAARISKLRGRRDELVVASGGNLYPRLFEDVLRGVRGIGHDWQVVFYLNGYREVMEIDVESVRSDQETLDGEVRQEIARKYPDLMKNLALGTFELRTVVYRPGSLRVGRKLPRLVDKRHSRSEDIQQMTSSIEANVS